MRFLFFIGGVLSLFLLYPAHAQTSEVRPAPVPTPTSTPTPAPRPTPIVSPEIHADRTVTFRLRAPDAQKVKMWGDWDGQGTDMVKDDAGVWSVTLGPWAPDIYTYSFNVDGVTMLDPQNLFVKPMRSATSSGLEIPGDQNLPAPLPYNRVAGVPRGEVHLREYDSKSLGKIRRLRVYTPAAYQTQPKKRFPVLYLLHGSGDNEATWSEFGRANVMLDNLIARKQAVPMIVVMTDGHASSNLGPDARGSNTSAFERDLLGDVMPFVETRYRISTKRDDRAIAGLSMGGNQALLIGLNHRDLFAYVAGMSSAIREPQAPLQTFWDAPNDPKLPMRLLWISIGKDDFLLKENRAFDALLTERRVPHEYTETVGGHQWLVWRRNLATLAPRLFQKNTRK